jgi:predicted nucleotidyltransferase
LLSRFHRQLERLYGARLLKLVLYGSQARGNAVDGSDIDVLVVLKGAVAPAREIARVSPIAAALSLDACMTLSCHFVSERRFQSEQSPLLMNVRREGVAV